MVKYTVKKLSGYQILKAVGTGDKDQADMIRDLIVAAVEPPLTAEEVEGLPLKELLELSNKVSETLGLKEADIKNLQTSAKPIS